MYILLLIIALLVIAFIILFNRLVRYKNMMKEAWSGIDVQLKRRHDLIPNIVEAVKGYMQHERKLFEDITNIRAKLAGTAATTIKETQEAEKGLSGVLKNIFAVAEAYPDLKANQDFLALQKGLTEIEDQIQLARRYYNGTVRNYNIAVQSFPGNLVANGFNFKEAEFFEIEYVTERQVPDVKFGG
jgi:LemA protein